METTSQLSHDATCPAQGAFLDDAGISFCVWAPFAEHLALDIEGRAPIRMQPCAPGFFGVRLSRHEDRACAGLRYGYRLPDGRLLPDPAARFLPGSVHERAMIVEENFAFEHDDFAGHALDELIFYELHVGTFTSEGTLDAAIAELPRLVELGITAVELMPVCAFDGERGWGYDGVQPYSVHRVYGGPWALARFVDAAHALDLSVFLDVVYNHFGPSGCYLRSFGPYFTDRVDTPWGEAIDFTVPAVRRYVIESALYFLRTFHLDGLRLDAVHAISDPSEKHVLQELAEAVAAEPCWTQGHRPLLIAESNLNSARLVRPRSSGGFGLDAQWSDDFHHALHALLTGERDGYYRDYGALDDLARAFRDGQAFTGQFSELRQAPYGEPTDGLWTRNFVVALQNHDQVGNRARGERLGALVDVESLRLAAAAVLLSPFLPLLFMGEPYGEAAPFLYFTGFPDPALGRAVTEGRRREFSRFQWQGAVPDPQDVSTFERSKLHPEARLRAEGKALWEWYRRLIALRRSLTGFASAAIGQVQVDREGGALVVTRQIDGVQTKLLLNFGQTPAEIDLEAGAWHVRLDSHAPQADADSGAAALPRLVSAHLSLQGRQAMFLLRSAAAQTSRAEAQV